MALALQIRDVPEDVRDRLASEARRRGQSLQAYLLGLVTREAELAARADMFFSTAHLRIDLEGSGFDHVGIIREGRDSGFDLDRDELGS